MSMTQIKNLEKERAALSKKIAEARSKLATKIGTELMKSFGDEDALTLSETLAKAAKSTSPGSTFARLRDCMKNSSRSERANGADAAAREGGAS